MYQSTQQFYNKQTSPGCISTRLLCGNIATCFESAGSSSDNRYINMSLVIGLFTDVDPDQWFMYFSFGLHLISVVKGIKSDADSRKAPRYAIRVILRSDKNKRKKFNFRF
jgi:hypothetical protein